MTTYILIIYIYAGAFSSGDSVALTNVPGFQTFDSCQRARDDLKHLVVGTSKNIETVCVKQ